MEEDSEESQNGQSENAFGDQMPLYPENYDVRKTVSCASRLLSANALLKIAQSL